MRTRQSTESLGGVSVSFGHRTVVSRPGLFVVVGNKSDIHGIYFLFPSKQLSRPSAPAETVLVEDNYIKICSVKFLQSIDFSFHFVPGIGPKTIIALLIVGN